MEISPRPGAADRAWPFFFAFVFLVLLGVNLKWRMVTTTDIALAAIATLPWTLRWFGSLVQTMKVAGMELNFRQELVQKIEDHEKAVAAALSSGIGKPLDASTPASKAANTPKAVAAVAGADDLLSHHALVAPDEGDEPTAPPSVIHPDDPNKGRFGLVSMAGGRRLSATVKPFPGSADLFRIQSVVAAVDASRPLADGTPVVFHLHPTFTPQTRTVRAAAGAAKLECVAWGAFTIGVEVDGVRLELDLARDVPEAPALFVQR